MSQASPLLDNPAFITDLHDNTLSGGQISRKWGIAKSAVNKWRGRLNAGYTPAPRDETPAGRDSVEESSDGTKTVTAIRDRPVTLADARAWISSTGDDPDDYTLSIRSIAYGQDMFSNRMSAVPKKRTVTAATIDLPALYAEVARTKTPAPIRDNGNRTHVVSWADMQLGKVGSRGGTDALIRRLEQKRAALRAHFEKSGVTHSVFVDAGDPLEGFENVASQMFTNDVSLPDQTDLAAVEMWKTLALMAEYGPVDAVAVPSNHGAWRNGKQTLGKPCDDWGLAIQKRLKFQADLIGLPVTFHRPAEWDESVALDVRGVRLGVHHGHQTAEDRMMDWWAGQQHGAQATADCDILLTGHYHHLRVQPSGRSKRTGRSKWWLQSPTLDNGSDWFRNHAGDDSDPGLLVFDITDEGFDLSSLTIL